MATPPAGPYGSEYPVPPHHGDARAGRTDLPATPNGPRPVSSAESGPGRPAPHEAPEPGGVRGPVGPTADGVPHVPPPGAHGVDAPTADLGPRRTPDHNGGTVPVFPRLPVGGSDAVDADARQPLVRPYAMTGGRTRPRYQLAIEALVSTNAEPVQLQGQLPEHQRICELCYEMKSVAEVSALLSIPLGVARILVADLAEAGLVAIHQPGHEGDPDGQPDVTLLERVLSGLRKL